jgi:hypothetical protein
MFDRRRAKHRLAVVGVLGALAAAALVPAASAGGGPQPLAPGQAQALVSAPAAVQSGAVTRSVSSQEALAAAALPGAVVSVTPGLSLLQAVGLGPAVSVSTGASSALKPVAPAAAAVSCASNAAWHEWGTWPYQQRITDTTYWCAVYGDHITYTSSTVNGTGTLCGTAWTSNQIISGGIGYSWFVTRSSAGWNCPTVIPWVTLHPSHFEDISRNAWGSTAEVNSG